MANIVSVTVSTSSVQVVFDVPIDGSTLDSDWLTDTDKSSATLNFDTQDAPNVVTFDTTPFIWSAGDAYAITRIQPNLAFPQTGVCV